MKDRGFTLIELLAVIVILAIIALIASPIIIGLIDDARLESFKNSSYGIIDSVKTGFAKQLLTQENPISTKYEYTEGVETKVQGNIDITYSGKKPENGILLINEVGETAIFFYENNSCAIKKYEDSKITIEKISKDECLSDGTDYIYFDEIKGVNRPQLVSGMVPIKWNGTTWVSTNTNDSEWYDYSQQKWANARTKDGSMWVWIPRYVYKISSGWHTSTPGTIDIQFSKGTDDNWNSGTIGNIDTGTTASASNNKWTNQPAFTFGTTELTGIWVAKFEPTATEGVANNMGADNVTTKTVKIVPNIQSWRYIYSSTAFNVSRAMETKDIYGWGTSGTGIDTHMMKNNEWGAVAYLSKSSYGNNGEIWINPANNYITGCAGDSTSSAATTGCLYTYDSTNGVKASTTGNIYGIYDMVGGAAEFVAAYVDNSDLNFSIFNAALKSSSATYKEVYSPGTTDNQLENYNLTVNKKGDAVWETSNGSSGSNSWFNDQSSMPYMVMTNMSLSLFSRGGASSETTNAGIFSFGPISGSAFGSYTFRPILLVNENL